MDSEQWNVVVCPSRAHASKLKCSSRARRHRSSPPLALDKKIECDQNKLHAQQDNINELDITYTWNAAVARIQAQKACMFLKLSAARCGIGRALGFSGNLSRK